MNVLTIDFDYFFLWGSTLDYPYMTDSYWISEYYEHADTIPKEVGFNYDAFAKIKALLQQHPRPIFVSEDHSAVYHVLKDNTTPLRIVNIDQHHDLEPHGSYGVHCGNWAKALTNSGLEHYTWVTNELSITESSDTKYGPSAFPIEITTDLDTYLQTTYDVVFLIQSYEYSPPHMQHRFAELVEACPSKILDEQFPIRYETLQDEADNLICRDCEESIALCNTEQEYQDSEADRRIPLYTDLRALWEQQGVEFDPNYFTIYESQNVSVGAEQTTCFNTFT